MYGEIVTRLRYKPAELKNTALTINGTKALLSIDPPEIPFPVLSDYEYCTIFLESFENNKDTLYEVKYEVHYKWNNLLYKIGEVTSVDGKAEFPRLIKGLTYYITAIPLDGKYQSKQVRITLDEYDIRQEPVALTTYENTDYKNYDHHMILKNVFGDATVYLDGNPEYISLEKNDKNLRVYLNKDATERASEFDLVIEDYRIEDIVTYRKKILVNDGFSTPYNISIEFTDSNAAIFKWSTDGIYEINKFYISDNIINKGNPIDVIGTSTYIITNYDNNKTQYLWLSSIRDGKEKISDPITIDAFDKSINPLVGPSVNYSINQNNDLLVYLNHNSTTVDNYSVYLEENEITSIDGLTPIATSASKNIVIPNFDVYNNYDKTLKLLATTNKYNHSYLSENKDLYAAYDWTPENLTNSAKIWANSENVVKDSGNRISQLTDKSGNNFHFTQSNDEYKPVLHYDSYINHYVIRFDGINDFVSNVSTDAATLFKNISNAFIFCVAKRRGSTGNGSIFYAPIGTTSASSRFNLNMQANSFQLSTRRLDSDSTDNLLSSVASNDYQIIVAIADYTTGVKKLYSNGILSQKTITPGITSNTNGHNQTIRIGIASVVDVAGAIDMDVLEIVVSNVEISDSDSQKLEGWAAHKYGLTDNLPVDHPYKNRKPVIDHTPTNLTAEFKDD